MDRRSETKSKTQRFQRQREKSTNCRFSFQKDYMIYLWQSVPRDLTLQPLIGSFSIDRFLRCGPLIKIPFFDWRVMKKFSLSASFMLSLTSLVSSTDQGNKAGKFYRRSICEEEKWENKNTILQVKELRSRKEIIHIERRMSGQHFALSRDLRKGECGWESATLSRNRHCCDTLYMNMRGGIGFRRSSLKIYETIHHEYSVWIDLEIGRLAFSNATVLALLEARQDKLSQLKSFKI